MENYNWSEFTLRIPVKAGVQEIYNCWSTQEGLEKWFLRKAEFITASQKTRHAGETVEAGDTYQWYWHGHDDKAMETGKIMAAGGIDHLQFSFVNDCSVSVRIFMEGEETIVELIQSNMLTDETTKVRSHLGCSIGWTFYLANLKSILEGGIDLRNKNLGIKNVVNS